MIKNPFFKNRGPIALKIIFNSCDLETTKKESKTKVFDVKSLDQCTIRSNYNIWSYLCSRRNLCILMDYRIFINHNTLCLSKLYLNTYQDLLLIISCQQLLLTIEHLPFFYPLQKLHPCISILFHVI